MIACKLRTSCFGVHVFIFIGFFHYAFTCERRFFRDLVLLLNLQLSWKVDGLEVKRIHIEYFLVFLLTSIVFKSIQIWNGLSHLLLFFNHQHFLFKPFNFLCHFGVHEFGLLKGLRWNVSDKLGRRGLLLFWRFMINYSIGESSWRWIKLLRSQWIYLFIFYILSLFIFYILILFTLFLLWTLDLGFLEILRGFVYRFRLRFLNKINLILFLGICGNGSLLLRTELKSEGFGKQDFFNIFPFLTSFQSNFHGFLFELFYKPLIRIDLS